MIDYGPDVPGADMSGRQLTPIMRYDLVLTSATLKFASANLEWLLILSTEL
jgi:hypothetical protein